MTVIHHYLDRYYLDGQLLDVWSLPVVVLPYSGPTVYAIISQRARELDIRQCAREINLNQGQRDINLRARTR